LASYFCSKLKPDVHNMIVFPNAKINIGLHITNKRPDGYHDLETVFYPVMIRDVLEVVEARELSFTSSGLNIPGTVESNICLKAYKLLSEIRKLPPVSIHLHKNIPIGAGLGGGSADASFFIRLMNDKFALELDISQMEEYAAKLGADCPFFIQNQPVYAFERGDKFENVNVDLGMYFIVLVMPAVQVPTADAFKHISPKPSKRSLRQLNVESIQQWKETVRNDFEPGIIKQYPVIGEIKDDLYEAGAIYASMSGSGSSVYGIFQSPIRLPQLELSNRVFYDI
jgi:4-diphosphocytidyl-2-C-methyl-D-erythritol kinase